MGAVTFFAFLLVKNRNREEIGAVDGKSVAMSTARLTKSVGRASP
jgi:hypothetical protein